MALIVGDEGSKFVEICNVFRGGCFVEVLMDKLIDLARNLEIPPEAINRFRTNEFKTPCEAFHHVLSQWRATSGNDATLDILVTQLESIGVVAAADALRSHFKLNEDGFQIKRKHSSSYVSPPLGVDIFLKCKPQPPLLVICTTDKHITTSKLTDTRSAIVQKHDSIEFVSALSSSSNCNHVYSITCDENDHVSVLLEKIGDAPKCKGIIITEKYEVIELRHVQVVRDTLKWSHLSESTQTELLRLRIKISGRMDTLKNVLKKIRRAPEIALAEQTLIDLLYRRIPDLLENNIPEPIGYYIPRTLRSRSLLKAEEIFKQKNRNDIFVFTGIQRAKLSEYASPQATDKSCSQIRLEQPDVKYIMLDTEVHFDELCKKLKAKEKKDRKHLHWIKYKNEHFFWVMSMGNMGTIQKAIEAKQMQEVYNEDNFVDMSHGIALPVIISDTPGMGKSFILACLARKLVSRGEVVLYGSMLNVVTRFKAASIKRKDTTEVILKIIVDLGGQQEIGNEILEEKIRSGISTIHLMLDGCDEVQYNDLKSTGDILRTIRSCSYARLWVTTRPHLLEALENRLEVLGHNILAFNSEDQRKCLIEYWISSKSCRASRLADYANTCLNQLHESMESSDHDIAGVPLQCRLIGEIFAQEARVYASSANKISALLPLSISIRSITDLFNRMIELKLKEYFVRYPSSNYSSEQLKLAHMLLSIHWLFPECENELKGVVKNFVPIENSDMLNIGLVVLVEGQLIFIHRTVTEFFVAAFMVQLIVETAGDEIVSRFLVKVLETQEIDGYIAIPYDRCKLRRYQFKHRVILYFLDNMVRMFENTTIPANLNANGMQIALSCVAGKLTQLFKYFDKMDILEWQPKDEIRNLVIFSVRFVETHIIRRVCYIYQKKTGTKVKEIQMIHRVFKRNINLLHIAVRYREFSVVEHLLNRQGFLSLVAANDESVRDIIFFCVDDSLNNDTAIILEKVDILKRLCGINPLLVEPNTSLGRPPIFGNKIHKSLLFELIKQKAEVIVTRGDTILTVLHFAAEYLNPVDYHELCQQFSLELLSEMLKIKNDKSETPLHKILTYFDPDKLTLQLFKDCGADFNAKHGNGSPVISVAIREGRSIATIEDLVFHGAEWNHPNPNKGNILFSVLEHRTFSVFKHFALEITNDADLKLQLSKASDWSNLGNINLSALDVDVNATYSNGNTLLHKIAAQHKNEIKVEVVKFLIANGSNIGTLNNEGETAFDIAIFNSPSVAPLLLSNKTVHSQRKAFTTLKRILPYVNSGSEKTYFRNLADGILALWPHVLTISDEFHDTLLHHAFGSQTKHSMEYLFCKGANAKVKNDRGHNQCSPVSEKRRVLCTPSVLRNERRKSLEVMKNAQYSTKKSSEI